MHTRALQHYLQTPREQNCSMLRAIRTRKMYRDICTSTTMKGSMIFDGWVSHTIQYQNKFTFLTVQKLGKIYIQQVYCTCTHLRYLDTVGWRSGARCKFYCRSCSIARRDSRSRRASLSRWHSGNGGIRDSSTESPHTLHR